MDREKKEQRTTLPWKPESGLVFTTHSRKSASHFCSGGQSEETQFVGTDSTYKTGDKNERRR
jgi:hypothetical protein